MDRKLQSKKRYVWAFVIGTLIFLFVFFISYSFSYLEFQRVSRLQGDVAYDIFEHKLDYTLFNQGLCSAESFDQISRDLHFQGRIIDDLEKKLGKNDKDVIFRKKFYTLIELEHFDFIRILNNECDLDIQTILFFYSNKESELERSEEVGRLLGAVSSRIEGSDLLIYSFDINLGTELIEKLMTKYGVEESPTLVINEGALVVNPKNIDEIEGYLE